jgi:glycine cleavage system H lipoate-binding protein
VFISAGHVWANVTVPGLVRIGIDDFARKMIGRVDAIEFPAKGSLVKKGERLFVIRQGERRAIFKTPITGSIHAVNADLAQNLAWLEKQPYERGWICSIKPAQLAVELEHLKIGENAATWYRQEIKRIRELLAPASGNGHNGHPIELPAIAHLVEGQLEEVDEKIWEKFSTSFLQ